MPNSPPPFQNWLEKAQDDVRWSEASLKDDVYHGTCFSAQQAVEKSLKAFFLAKGQVPRRIHDLVALLEDCMEVDPTFEELREACVTLTDYYVESRYPDISEFMDYTRDQAEEALKMARGAVNFVVGKLTA